MHHGFYTAYQSTVLRPAILSTLQNIKKIYGNISIIVTGHSMGGALASFCALDLVVLFFFRASVLTKQSMCNMVLAVSLYPCRFIGWY